MSMASDRAIVRAAFPNAVCGRISRPSALIGVSYAIYPDAACKRMDICAVQRNTWMTPAHAWNRAAALLKDQP